MKRRGTSEKNGRRKEEDAQTLKLDFIFSRHICQPRRRRTKTPPHTLHRVRVGATRATRGEAQAPKPPPSDDKDESDVSEEQSDALEASFARRSRMARLSPFTEAMEMRSAWCDTNERREWGGYAAVSYTHLTLPTTPYV